MLNTSELLLQTQLAGMQLKMSTARFQTGDLLAKSVILCGQTLVVLLDARKITGVAGHQRGVVGGQLEVLVRVLDRTNLSWVWIA